MKPYNPGRITVMIFFPSAGSLRPTRQDDSTAGFLFLRFEARNETKVTKTI